ncbi:MAG TPA: MATE family efflux transporter, partial [Clostridiales bacterium]|nr:MATE family efflux transporter [Clostridiales bacterium]
MKTMKDTSVLKEFAKYVSANVIAMIGLSCYILADTFFISLKMGQTGLAALNLSSPSFNIVFSIGMMFAVGGGTRFAILKGAKNDDEANKAFTHTILIVALFAVIFVILGIFASRPIAQFLGAEGDTLEYSNTYVQIILCFAPFFMFSNVFQNFIRNDGAPRLAMIASLSGNLFNILFDYVLVFPCNLDMLGAALATGFSPIVSILILSSHVIRKKNTFHLRKTKLSARTYGRICSLGFAPFITEISFAIVLTVFNGLFKKLGGDTAIAAYTIVINVFYVTNSIFNGVANGTQPMISFSYGESDHKKIRQILKYALVTVSSIAILMYVAIFFGADGIASVFNTQGVEA